MQTDKMIAADEFCTHHHVELSFIHSLKESGLLEVSVVEEKVYLPVSQLCHLEKIIRLYEMDINLEGIETISYLLERMNSMQEQIRELNNRLSFYEHR